MKKTVLLIVVFVVLGIIFFPELTKRIVSITGGATLETGKEVLTEVKESPEIQEKYQKFKEKVNESVEDIQDKILS